MYGTSTVKSLPFTMLLIQLSRQYVLLCLFVIISSDISKVSCFQIPHQLHQPRLQKAVVSSGSFCKSHKSRCNTPIFAHKKGLSRFLLRKPSTQKRNKNGNDTTLMMTDSTATAVTGSNKNKGRLLLLFVAFLYGSLNVVFRLVYAMPNPPLASTLSFTRGWLAAASFLPIILTNKKEPEAAKVESDSANDDTKTRPIWKAALELAFWNFGAQGLLNVGLLFTDAARASFLTQSSVVITPIISILAGQVVPKIVWAGCVAALAGLVMLSGAGAAGASLAFSTGDLLVMGGALSWSMYLFRISSVGKRYPEIPLQALKTTLLACLYGVWFVTSAGKLLIEGSPITTLWFGWKNLAAWGMLLYSAVGPGAIADVLQQVGQKEVNASEANVILSSEPIFTAICARLILGEVTSQTENIGGSLIVLGALLASSA